MEHKFISFDPSLTNTGVAVGVIHDCKRIEVTNIFLTESKKSDNKKISAGIDTINRCRKTSEFIDEVIARENPKIIFAEMPSGSQSASAMKGYGVTCMMIAIMKPLAIAVTPIHVKTASVGRKNASKAEIIEWAYNLFPDVGWKVGSAKNKMEILDKNGKFLTNKNEHMADAIAAAFAGIETDEYKRIIPFL